MLLLVTYQCPCGFHWIFETEPVCMSGINSGVGVSILISDLLDVYRYVVHLSQERKREFIQNNVFNFASFDVETIHVNLSPTHFENCLTYLSDFLIMNKVKIMCYLSLDYFKSRLAKHLKKCKGPCKLTQFGFPICNLSHEKIMIIDKMMAGLIVIAQNHTSHEEDIQTLFNLSIQPAKYNYFITFVKHQYDTKLIFFFKNNYAVFCCQ